MKLHSYLSCFLLSIFLLGCSDNTTVKDVDQPENIQKTIESSETTDSESQLNLTEDENRQALQGLEDANAIIRNMDEDYDAEFKKNELALAGKESVSPDEYKKILVSTCKVNPAFTSSFTNPSKLLDFCEEITDCNMREIETAFSGWENFSRSDPDYFEKMFMVTGKCIEEVNMNDFK